MALLRSVSKESQRTLVVGECQEISKNGTVTNTKTGRILKSDCSNGYECVGEELKLKTI